MWICDVKKEYYRIRRGFLLFLIISLNSSPGSSQWPTRAGGTLQDGHGQAKTRQPAGGPIPVWRCCQPPSSFPRGDRETSLNPEIKKNPRTLTAACSTVPLHFCCQLIYMERAPHSIFHSRPDMKLICNSIQHMARDWSPGRTEAQQ